MIETIGSLFDYEKERLLAALRRDLRFELLKAAQDPIHAKYHLHNHRVTVRLLEILNPKNASRDGPNEARCKVTNYVTSQQVSSVIYERE